MNARALFLAVAASAALAGVPPAQAQSLSLFTKPAKTKHPVVLVHGFIGFDNIFGAVNYYYNIPGSLRRNGANVYIASLNPSQTTEFRGEELIQQMKQWAAADKVSKFNLIGHSHGGPTVRYAASTVPSMVASVTTMAGTHFGSKVADEVLEQYTDGGLFDRLSTAGMKLISWLTGNKTTRDTDLTAALGALSSEGSAAFNAKFPAAAPTTPCGQGPEVVSIRGHQIRWYSFSGTAIKTNRWDISDLIMADGAKYFGNEPNDGQVGRCASHWGRVIRDDYPWNHFDQVNQVLGLVGRNAPDPVAFYVQHVSRLKAIGL